MIVLCPAILPLVPLSIPRPSQDVASRTTSYPPRSRRTLSQRKLRDGAFGKSVPRARRAVQRCSDSTIRICARFTIVRCLLLRPDLHVAWRRDGPVEDPTALAAITTGH